MKKKLLSIVLATVMLLTVIPLGAVSVSSATSGDYTYTVDNDEARITGYNGPGGAITIPSTLGGYPVTAIEDYAFDDTYADIDSTHTPYYFDEDALTLVAYIEDGYGDFGENEYWFGTRNDKTYTTVGPCRTSYNGFYCKLYEMSDDSVPTVVTEPEISKTYKFGMIQGNVSNTTVYYLNGTMNGYYMDTTTNWNAAIDVYLEDSDSGGDYHLYTKNADGAKLYINMVVSGTHVNGVYEMSSVLTSVTIPDSVTYIGDDAFFDCDSLTTITVSENNTAYSSADGVLFNKDKTTLIMYPVGKSGAYIIPDSVTTIGNYAFYNCDSLTTVTIPNSVTTIGERAFYACDSLTSVTIPDSVTSIGDDAFYACDSLTSMTIPNSVITIGDGAFNYSGLTSVTIGNGVTSIGDTAFGHCSNLTAIEVSDRNVKYCSLDGVLFNKSKTELIQYPCLKPGVYTIPNTVTTIGEDAFYDCDSLTTVIIPNSVTTIGEQAFYACDSLTAIIVSEENPNYSSVDGVLFNKDKSVLLKCPAGAGTCIVPNGVTTIESAAFYGCDNLTSISIPLSVITIGYEAFYWCDNLASVYYSGSVLDRANITIGDDNDNLLNATWRYAKSDEPGVPANLTYTIANGAVTITSYNDDRDLVIPDTIKGYPVTTIGNGAFFGSGLTSVTIPDSVTTIGDGAFELCSNLTSVTIPDSVTSIGGYAFSGCSKLIAIEVSSRNAKYCSVDGVLFNKSKTKLIQYPYMKSGAYIIPNSVTTIGDWAFYNCSKLTSVTIPNSVTTIGSAAFEACTSLTSVNIGNGVTTISDWAFADCDSLTSVTIGDNVTLIYDYAFFDCESLTSVTIPVSIIAIGNFAFAFNSLTDVYYGGSEEDKANKNISPANESLNNATWHYNSVNPKDSFSNQVDHSVMDTANGNGLAFRFELTATGVEKNNRNVIDLSNATIDYLGAECKLIGMGTVVTNNSTAAGNLTLDAVNDFNVINVPTVYLQEADEESCAFATRIIDIPDTSLERVIYARPYYIVEVDGEQITVYGDVNSATCAEYL